MAIKITTPNGGSDSLDFGCAQTAIVATVTGTEVSSGEGKLEFKTTTGSTSATKVTVLANGNVGIGTAAPAYPLDVYGVVGIKSGESLSWKGDAQLSAAITGEGATPVLKFWTSVNERMRIDAGGNVGIGTTAPEAKLDIRSDIDESSTYTGQLAINSVTKSTGNLARMMFSHDNHGSASIASDYESSGYGNLIFSTRGGGNPTERMRITGAGDLKFNSGYGSAATAYGCRAWVNFNGQGTLAIRDSANVSSVTDVATGNYRVNFTTAMPDVNYVSTGMAGGAGADQINVSQNFSTEIPAVGSCRYTIAYANGSAWDPIYVGIAIFR